MEEQADEKIRMTDLRDLEVVQVQVSKDGTRLWVNTEKGCILRIQNIRRLEVADERFSNPHDTCEDGPNEGELQVNRIYIL